MLLGKGKYWQKMHHKAVACEDWPYPFFCPVEDSFPQRNAVETQINEEGFLLPNAFFITQAQQVGGI